MPKHHRNYDYSLDMNDPRSRNVAAQVAEELKTVTYATPPMGELIKKDKKL